MDLFAFDDEYVRRLRDGDRWTEEHFLNYFQRLLLIKLRSRVRSVAAIDDIRQEVFVRVFRMLRSEGGLHDGRKLGAFVNSVCNNVLMEWNRTDRRTEALDETQNELADPSDIEEAFASGEMRERVRHVLSLLPKRDAEILRAIFFEEGDKDEYCRKFGVDRPYLRVLLHRAKEKFRTEFMGKVATFPAQDETPRPDPSLPS
jgi:RNA polymerase sigma-70 factor (ECF subfamily)